MLGVETSLDGMPAAWALLPAFRPASERSCSSTRSRPVTSSVTGCSTWSLAFSSMNQ